MLLPNIISQEGLGKADYGLACQCIHTKRPQEVIMNPKIRTAVQVYKSYEPNIAGSMKFHAIKKYISLCAIITLSFFQLN